MLTDSRSEESSQKVVYAEEIDLVSESCSVSRRQPWRDKQLLSRFSRWFYQECREVKNEIKGKDRITQGVSVRGQSGDGQSNLRPTPGSSDVATDNKNKGLMPVSQSSLSHSDNISLVVQS